MKHATRSQTCQVLGTLVLTLLMLVAGGCSRAERIARLLDKANRYFTAGDYEKAEIEYKNVLKKDPQNAGAICRLGVIYHEQGREQRAAAFLVKARELQPDNLEVRLKLAYAHLADGGLPAAREEALYVLERQPADSEAPLLLLEGSSDAALLEDTRTRLEALPEKAVRAAPALTALGHVALRQNRPADAEKLFQQALAADPKSPAVHGGLAVLALAHKDIESADREFKESARLSPPRSPRRLHYARFKLQSGDTAGARAFLEEMTRATPDSVTAWLWLAEVATMERKLDEATSYAGKALAREPQHPEALFINARIRIAKGEADKAVPELERLQQNFPRSPQIAYQLALAYVAAGDVNKAIARLTQLVAAVPGLYQAAYTLAELQYRKRDFTAALAILKPLTQQHPEIVAAQLLLAESLRGTRDFDEAARIYAELQKQRPADADIAFARGTVLLQQNKRHEARAAFEKTRELKPGHFGALEQLVQLDLADKAVAAARQRVEAEIQRTPSSAPLFLLLANACRQNGDTAAAETALKKAIELQPDLAAAQVELVRLYIDSNQQDKALSSLQEATKQRPKSVAPFVMLGVMLHERKDYAGARDAYEKALALDPKNSLALNNLAFLYAERFDLADKAVELAQRARALLPNEPRTADTLGWALTKKKQYAQAISLLQESAAKLPEEPDAHYHLGIVHYMLGDERAARSSLSRAIELKSEFPGVDDAQNRLALLAVDLADTTPASHAIVEKALAARPDDPAALLRAGEFERRKGDGDKALADYKAVLQGNPRHALALLGTARVYASKRDLTKALENGKAARNAAPENPEITHAVSRIAYEAGDQRWAASLLQELAKTNADDPEVLFDWAEAAYSVGRVADSETSMKRALELKNFPRAAAATRFVEMLTLCSDPARAAGASAKVEAALKADADCAPAQLAMALIAEQKSDADTARQRYEKMLGQFPDFSPAQRNLTILYAAQSSDNVKAAAVANKARQVFPNDPALARAAGVIAYRQGEFGKAVSLLQQATARNNSDAEALYYIGMAQGRLNKRSESKQSLQRALELGLKDNLAAEAKKTIASTD